MLGLSQWGNVHRMYPLLAWHDGIINQNIDHKDDEKAIFCGLCCCDCFLLQVYCFTTMGANFIGKGDQITTDSKATPVDRLAEVLVENELDGTNIAAAFENVFVNVAENVDPAVVQVRAEKVVRQRQSANPFQGSPFGEFFAPFNGQPQEREFRSQGLGSGVVYNSDGYIVTNHHVVEGAENIQIVFSDGEILDGENRRLGCIQRPGCNKGR